MGGASKSKRFELVRRLGEGGMGIVYEALDRDRGERVALKTLRTYSTPGLVRFKREFRALQDLDHPNVVALGELISEDDEWFFTMELVEGSDFLEYVRGTDCAVRGGDHRASHTTQTVARSRTTQPERGDVALPEERSPPSLEQLFDEVRLRAALRQLVDAIGALHDAGLVHRDVKSSNIRVTGAQRVVLLDFGIVGNLGDDHHASALQAMGTPEYMAPEQVAGTSVGPAADWYSVGVLLYEALSGQLPFRGAPDYLMTKKQWAEPPPPSVLAPGVPRDLEALCMALLQYEPTARPLGADIALALGASQPRERASSRPARQVFVGRARELGLLRRAYDDAVRGQATSVFLHGESGVGKSSLVRHFVDTLADDEPGLVVLAGRCYERESVPFKAFDGVVDALARSLGKLPPGEASALVPPNVASLSTVFPVLLGVEAIAERSRAPARALDPLDLRSRAFAALRELLGRASKRWRIVVLIDDVQWADADSRVLLEDVLGRDDSPKVLVVATKRTAAAPEGAAGDGDFAAALPGRITSIELGCLPTAEACELARRLLEQQADQGLGPEANDATSIAKEAAGHPLFIDVLVRHDRASGGGVRLEDALRARIARLDDLARGVVETLAVAGAPLAPRLLARASGAEAPEVTKRVASLRAAHLVITTGTRGDDPIDLFHDRVRAAVLAGLEAPAKTARHAQLADALEATEGADAEMLATHWRSAGDLERAARYTIAAADRAARALAFDHAARLYQAALAMVEHSREERHQLNAKLADVLASAGRGALAAQAFFAAAEGLDGAEALVWQRRGSSQLLRAGHIDEGIASLEGVLASVGWRMPRTERAAYAVAVFYRVLLFLRGYAFEERGAKTLPPTELAKIDLCAAIGHCLSMTDYARSRPFQVMQLWLALRAGELTRVARAVAAETLHYASRGSRRWRRTERLMAQATALAERTGSPEAVGWARFACGYGYYLNGRYRRGFDVLEESLAILREGHGTFFEVTTVQRAILMCLALLGDLKELRARRPLYIRQSSERGDLYGLVNLRLGYSNIAWLVSDDPDEARAEIAESLRQWSKGGFHLEHYFALVARVNADLYAGDAAAALDVMTREWPALERSLLLAVQTVRVLSHAGFARAALALASTGAGDRAALVARAKSHARALEGEGCAWARPIAALTRAGIALAGAHDAERARGWLEKAARGFDEVDMALHAAAARRCLGAVVGGDEGRAEAERATAWMTAQGIESPERMTAMLAPGLPQ